MSFASKIILGFLIVAAMVFWYLAMYTLDLRGWQKVAQSRQKTLDTTLAQSALLRNSTDANAKTELELLNLPTEDPMPPGRKQLRFDLANLMADRGRMWRGNVTTVPNTPGAPLTFKVQPNTEPPTPLTLTPKTSLYVFEYPPVIGDPQFNAPPGQYLGEFVVLENPPVDAAGGTFAMAPAKSMSPREQQRLTAAIASAVGNNIPWVAYETLPQDRHNVFAGLTAEDIETNFPGIFTAEQKNEFLKNGQAWTEDDPADRKDSLGKYRRPLVDFGQMMQTLYRWRSELNAKIATLQKDLSLMTAANEDVQKQIVHRKDEIVTLQEELAKMEAETKLVQDHLATIEAKLASVRAASTRLQSDNRKLVAQLASLQREAVEAARTETASATP
jgi:hypothetical protein